MGRHPNSVLSASVGAVSAKTPLLGGQLSYAYTIETLASCLSVQVSEQEVLAGAQRAEEGS